jgi:uncharacterized membrane protein
MSKGLVNRRRTAPWIQRWSRPLLGGVAILGALNTAYITISKFTNTNTACPSGGCEQVLSSPYATVFGLPLALFGLVAYISMAIFALAPLAIQGDQQKELRSNLENWTWFLLFLGSTAMLIFSGYLMSIMFTQFVVPFGVQGICYYCIASAIFAASLFVLTLLGRVWDDIGQLLFSGLIVGVVTLVATLAIYAPVGKPVADAYNIASASGQVFATIKDTSGESEIQLARHLKQTGAKMYSAYWCPHCTQQKKLFGVAALNDLPYVECAPDGKDSQTAACQTIAAQVEKQTGQGFGFPTWELNGKFYPGQQTLQQLADASGYKGPRSFKNSL